MSFKKRRMMQDDVQFLFIVGRGRSGTSLLQTILNAHPGIAVAPEAQFIMYLRRKYRNRTFTTDLIRRCLKDLWLEERMQNWHLDADELEHALKQLDKPDFAAICKEVYKAYGRRRGKNNLKVVGDKNPHYALYLPQLHEVYPNAKFIHIVRDPRDTVLSYQKVNFDADSAKALAYRWNIYNSNIERFKQLHPGQFYTLRFEDLLMQPEETLYTLTDFLNVDYTPEMLEFYKQEQDWDTTFRQNLKKPLDAGHAYRWKSRMPEQKAKAVTAITAPLAQKMGYETLPVARGLIQQLSNWPFWLYARWVAFLEQLVYVLPLSVLARIIAVYRKLTAT